MKVCVLTWEFPPLIVGGLARHCHGLGKAMAEKGHDINVATLAFPGSPASEEIDGVKVFRASAEIGHPHFITWTLLFNHFLEKRIADIDANADFDVLHVHDWLTAPAGIALKHFAKKPMVFTVHSTEYGRSGLHSPDSFAIDGIEWWATYDASKVIVTTEFMKREVCGHFHLPWDKVDVIPNAIDFTKFNIYVDRDSVRRRYGINPHEKLVLCVGRLVPQKGVEYLIQAIPRIAQRYPEAKFIIVGEGWLKGHLEYLANQTGQRWKITFTGFIPDMELVNLMKSADVLVIPSIYEPFGIVALEGMAAGVPVVVSQIGGLTEVVEHDRTGIFVYARSSDSIAWGVDRVLSDWGHATWLTQNAKEKVQSTYSWEAVAMKTIEVFEKIARR